MEREQFSEMAQLLAEISAAGRDLVETIQAADRGRNDALCAIGAIKAATQAQSVEIQALTDRLEANEQAVQSCLSTLGELNKMVHALAARATGLPGIPRGPD